MSGRKAEYMREYVRKNRDKMNEAKRQHYYRKRENPDWVERERGRALQRYHELRHDAMIAYGGYVCACCGETEPNFLSLDHIENDGADHRRKVGKAIWKWLRDNNYPEGFQVLCMNCNHGKARNNGICPHKLSPKKTA